jgi:hypothetical protein
VRLELPLLTQRKFCENRGIALKVES